MEKEEQKTDNLYPEPIIQDLIFEPRPQEEQNILKELKQFQGLTGGKSENLIEWINNTNNILKTHDEQRINVFNFDNDLNKQEFSLPGQMPRLKILGRGSFSLVFGVNLEDYELDVSDDIKNNLILKIFEEDYRDLIPRWRVDKYRFENNMMDIFMCGDIYREGYKLGSYILTRKYDSVKKLDLEKKVLLLKDLLTFIKGLEDYKLFYRDLKIENIAYDIKDDNVYFIIIDYDDKTLIDYSFVNLKFFFTGYYAGTYVPYMLLYYTYNLVNSYYSCAINKNPNQNIDSDYVFRLYGRVLKNYKEIILKNIYTQGLFYIILEMFFDKETFSYIYNDFHEFIERNRDERNNRYGLYDYIFNRKYPDNYLRAIKNGHELNLKYKEYNEQLCRRTVDGLAEMIPLYNLNERYNYFYTNILLSIIRNLIYYNERYNNFNTKLDKYIEAINNFISHQEQLNTQQEQQIKQQEQLNTHQCPQGEQDQQSRIQPSKKKQRINQKYSKYLDIIDTYYSKYLKYTNPKDLDIINKDYYNLYLKYTSSNKNSDIIDTYYSKYLKYKNKYLLLKKLLKNNK